MDHGSIPPNLHAHAGHRFCCQPGPGHVFLSDSLLAPVAPCRLSSSSHDSEETSEMSSARALMELNNQQHLGSCDVWKASAKSDDAQSLPAPGPHVRAGPKSNWTTAKCKREAPGSWTGDPCPRSKPGKRKAAQSAQDAILAGAIQRQLNSSSATKRHRRPYHDVSIPVA